MGKEGFTYNARSRVRAPGQRMGACLAGRVASVCGRSRERQVKLISARYPEPYCISIYLEVENTSAGPILKENLVYTKQQADSTLRV